MYNSPTRLDPVADTSPARYRCNGCGAELAVAREGTGLRRRPPSCCGQPMAVAAEIKWV